MPVTLMPSAKIPLDLTLVPAKSVLREMEKHALVRFLLWLNDQLFQKRKKNQSFSFPVQLISNKANEAIARIA